MINVNDLNIYFGAGSAAIHAVKSASFIVKPGESYGLVGESGSGKSTVLRAIIGLVNEWTGNVIVAGQSVDAKRQKSQRKMMQMVFQDPYGSLHPRRSINDTLKEPLAIHGFDNQEQRVVDALNEVGLGPEFRFRYPHQVSGGQRQRVAIARALILEPQIILLDEPTSALDVSVQAEILNLLQKIQRERNLTYIMVSHDLAVVGHICNRIAVMNRGSIIEEISDDQLRSGEVDHAYSKQLWTSSKGFDRVAMESFEDFD